MFSGDIELRDHTSCRVCRLNQQGSGHVAYSVGDCRCDALLAITDQPALLARSLRLANSIKSPLPCVEALNQLQVDLLHRRREGDIPALSVPASICPSTASPRACAIAGNRVGVDGPRSGHLGMNC